MMKNKKLVSFVCAAVMAMSSLSSVVVAQAEATEVPTYVGNEGSPTLKAVVVDDGDDNAATAKFNLVVDGLEEGEKMTALTAKYTVPSTMTVTEADEDYMEASDTYLAATFVALKAKDYVEAVDGKIDLGSFTVNVNETPVATQNYIMDLDLTNDCTVDTIKEDGTKVSYAVLSNTLTAEVPYVTIEVAEPDPTPVPVPEYVGTTDVKLSATTTNVDTATKTATIALAVEGLAAGEKMTALTAKYTVPSTMTVTEADEDYMEASDTYLAATFVALKAKDYVEAENGKIDLGSFTVEIKDDVDYTQNYFMDLDLTNDCTVDTIKEDGTKVSYAVLSSTLTAVVPTVTIEVKPEATETPDPGETTAPGETAAPTSTPNATAVPKPTLPATEAPEETEAPVTSPDPTPVPVPEYVGTTDVKLSATTTNVDTATKTATIALAVEGLAAGEKMTALTAKYTVPSTMTVTEADEDYMESSDTYLAATFVALKAKDYVEAENGKIDLGSFKVEIKDDVDYTQNYFMDLDLTNDCTVDTIKEDGTKVSYAVLSNTLTAVVPAVTIEVKPEATETPVPTTVPTATPAVVKDIPMTDSISKDVVTDENKNDELYITVEVKANGKTLTYGDGYVATLTEDIVLEDGTTIEKGDLSYYDFIRLTGGYTDADMAEVISKITFKVTNPNATVKATLNNGTTGKVEADGKEIPATTSTPTPTPTPTATPTNAPIWVPGGGGSSSGSGGNGVIAGSSTGSNASTNKPSVTVTFSDLGDAAWATTAITALAAKGAINGYDDGTFKPNQSVTRAEFTKMLMGAYNMVVPEGALTEKVYSDVNEGDWYYGTVYYGSKLGIINGYDDGTFRPNALVSRQEMAVIVYRMATVAKTPLNAVVAPKTFDDANEMGAWAVEPISVLQQAGVINGTSDTTFEPTAGATRAQAAQIIYNLDSLR